MSWGVREPARPPARFARRWPAETFQPGRLAPWRSAEPQTAGDLRPPTSCKFLSLIVWTQNNHYWSHRLLRNYREVGPGPPETRNRSATGNKPKSVSPKPFPGSPPRAIRPSGTERAAVTERRLDCVWSRWPRFQ